MDHPSPSVSTSSLDVAQLISVADVAEKTFSQQQQSSQTCQDPVKSQEHSLPSHPLKSSPEIEELQASDKLGQTIRNGVKLSKRKAESPPQDVKPKLQRLAQLDQLIDLEQVDIKPSFRQNSSLVSNKISEQADVVDKKPKLEEIEINSNQGREEGSSRNGNRSNSAEQILKDFTRRICNSIYRLNKSLLDLPAMDNQKVLTVFNSQNVQDHVNLLVRESFHNPHLTNSTTTTATTAHDHHGREGTSRSTLPSHNHLPDRSRGPSRLEDWSMYQDDQEDGHSSNYSLGRNSDSINDEEDGVYGYPDHFTHVL